MWSPLALKKPTNAIEEAVESGEQLLQPVAYQFMIALVVSGLASQSRLSGYLSTVSRFAFWIGAGVTRSFYGPDSASGEGIMQRICGLALVAVLSMGASQAWSQSVVFDFEDGTDQGFGTGFGNDASASYPIVSIAGSQRLELLDTAAFQQAGRETGNPADPQYIAMLAASVNESLATLSYDWYIDTSLSPGNYGNFLQLGTYVNTGSGYYFQNFPGAGKEVELNGAQLASGQVFSGTVSFTLASKGYNIPAGETFFRLGLISNGDGTQAKVYFDNIGLSVVPEPTTIVMAGLGLAGMGLIARRRK